jgi:transposase
MEKPEAVKAQIKYIRVDRNQLRWETLDVERLIAEDHPARIIWAVSGRLDVSGFEQEHRTQEGDAGRPCWPARLLVSVWVYSYTLGVASARGIERMMSHEPGLRWLAANETINHHTLADFRVGHQAALEDLFAQFLALLEEAGLVDLRTLLQDGTKVRAVAGSRSFHRRKTLEKRLRQARRVVRELDQQARSEEAGMDERRRAAQARAAREALARAQAALEKLQQLEAVTGRGKQAELRVSDSESEARKMKQPDGGWAPSYNVQVSTEVKSRIIIGIGVTTAANDTQELLPALEKVRKNCGKTPAQVIADNGYATRSNVEQTSKQNIDLIAPWKQNRSREAGACTRHGIAVEFGPAAFALQGGGKSLRCPAGKSLVLIQQKTHHGVVKNIYQARSSDCGRCRFWRQCCGKRGAPRRIARVVESRAMKKYLARMQRPEIRRLYRKRSEVAEFPHLWMKAVIKWRRFSVRGLVKTGMEAVWVALSYNMTQWIRLRPAVPAAA